MVLYLKLKTLIVKHLPKQIFTLLSLYPGIKQFEASVSRLDSPSGELWNIFTGISSGIVHKWHHYIPIYETHLTQYKNQEVRILEIGVDGGGSLELWRKFFGEKSIIYGIDINPKCLRFDGLHAKVRIGSQTSRKFLNQVINEMGGVDVVIDDGSHNVKDVRKTFEILFPLLNYDGSYIIEDLHCSFWRKFGGGYYSHRNLFRYFFRLIRHKHSIYTGRRVPAQIKEVTQELYSVHLYDSISVIEKKPSNNPKHSRVGRF